MPNKPIITKQEFAHRRQQLMQKIGSDAVVIVANAPEYIRNGDVHYSYRSDSDFYYLTGFAETQSIAVLLPGREQGEYILFNRPNNEMEEIWNGKRAGQQGAQAYYGANEAYSITEFKQKLPELISGRQTIYYPIGRYAVLDKQLFELVKTTRQQTRAGTKPLLSLSSIEHYLHDMRLFKTDAEMAVMREAAAISIQAHQRAIQACRPGLYEYQLEAELLHTFYQHGARTVAYESIVAGGANACILHYTENNAQLNAGDLVLIDAGCEYQHYASDITRTFPVSGHFSAEQKAVYDIVLQAQINAIAAIKPGVDFNTMQTICIRTITEGLIDLKILQGQVEELIEQKAYSKFYMHGSSHWLGMDVHDVGQYKNNGQWRLLEAGMVFTVEPGIYIAANNPVVDKKWWNIGIRIEDDVLVTKQNCEVLTAALPKTTIDLEALR